MASVKKSLGQGMRYLHGRSMIPPGANSQSECSPILSLLWQLKV